MKITREFAGPNSNTFDIPPIAGFVQSYLLKSSVSVDPFARNKRWATYTNDLNPGTNAEYHMDAVDFLQMLNERGISADLVIFDPPYSPRQVSECYQGIGKAVTMEDTQNGLLYCRARNEIAKLCTGVVLSFGWNSNGMGKKHGYEIEAILICAHGGAHNDTICVAERKSAQEAMLL